ncbi:MAG: serine hydrolase domain-containing protein [Chloroflexota bacterium]
MPGSSTPRLDAAFAQLTNRVRAAQQRLGVPGVTFGVLHGTDQRVGALGVTSLEHPLDVTTETLFQIGSISKTVTATAIMRLVERGDLDLNAPARSYLPELRLADESVARAVEVRHLLNHTGGWVGDFFPRTSDGDDALASVLPQLESLPQITPLGATHSYNNAAFYIAGRLIERATGLTYERAAHDLVLGPLGMARSYFGAEPVITERFAVGHQAHAGAHAVARPWGLSRAANPVGGIVSSVPDLLRYARFHLGDGHSESGERLLKAETIELMQRPLDPSTSVGVSWMLDAVGGARTFGHSGATNGQMALLLHVPERSFAVAVLASSSLGAALNREVSLAALELILGIAPEPVPTVRVDATDLAACLGRYRARLNELELFQDGSELMLRVTPTGGFPFADSPPRPALDPVRVAFTSRDRLLALDVPFTGNPGEILRDGNGNVEWLRFGGRIARKL